MRLIDTDELFCREIDNDFCEGGVDRVVDWDDIIDAPTIQAISLNKIKEAKEEIEQNAYPIIHGVNDHDVGMTLNGIFQVLDKLIEGEGE